MRFDPDPDAATDESDSGLLNALAASHAGFGQFETALALLALSMDIHSAQTDAPELAAVISMRAGRPGDALAAINRIERGGGALSGEMIALRGNAEALQLSQVGRRASP